MVWAVVDQWMIFDGMVPPLAAGQTWEAGLELALADAVEVDSSTRPALRIRVDPVVPATPTYEVVGRIGPHPWPGWRVVDAAAVSFVARDGGRELPDGATVRALSPLRVEPDHWDDGLKAANPLGWRRWQVRQVLEAPAFGEAGTVYVQLEAMG